MAERQPVPISATPAAGQLVEHNGKTYDTIQEGRAFILIPPNTRTSMNPQAKAKPDDGSDIPQNVFYNPIQQFNRDLSVLAIKAFGEDLCEKRRVRHERDRGKITARKERKRSRKIDAVEKQVYGGSEVVEKAENHTEDHSEEHAEGHTEEQIDGAEAGESNGLGAEKTAAEDVADIDLLRAQQGTKRKAEDESDELSCGAASAKKQRTNGEAPGPVDLGKAMEGKGEDVSTEDNTTGEVPSANINGQHNHPPWKPRFRILDALSATGLRALRYASEIPFATGVTANDMDRGAVRSIKTNVEYNKLGGKITPNLANAMGHMYATAFPPTDSHGPNHINGRYDVIDLDPYGSAAPFIDSALQALNDGGMLCVTCTDSGVFASCGYCEKTFSLYGGMPIKGNHSHEGGLRLITNSVATAAAKYGLAIEPLLSLSIDFYVRIFIRVAKSPADVKFLAGKTMIVYDCDHGCGAWQTQMIGRNALQTGKAKNNSPTFNFKHGIEQGPSTDRLCEHCGSKMHIAGPMWAGPLHNAAFVEKLLGDAQEADPKVYQTKQRLEGMIDTARGELLVLPNAEIAWPVDSSKDGAKDTLPKTAPEVVDLHPFFFIPSALAKVVHCIAPPEAAIKGALRHAGYKATRSHCKPGSVKTDAPWFVIWEVMREWVRQKSPIKEGSLKEGQPGWKVMAAARKILPKDDEVDGETAKSSSPDVATEEAAELTGKSGEDPKTIEVVFDDALGRDKPGKRLVRYQQNPRENWGPMTRAKGSA
ncbi:RNA methyltransferase tRNA(m5U54)methyltransferase [Recurvomyces mirabilis]|uniref:tRNA (guanine(26)-N(2))-dimethyltransferase n=1 Tax=Recurvomyces mirabilis TaxID=574656 RepID=A0AAE1C603_9PEZI|nr:RNA methyltransferase tRNA(m5U54)methyltransferase [Recurvomyces mirabilis]KAK5158906.1 RNA methyltransferase tRNA(m5U54)methyltransferase [Recurvomyces mirabilis]